MAFENVRLTPEETEEIAARRIKNPYGSAEDIVEGVKPSYLTIDKETNTWLTWCYRHRDVDENIEEFLFMYKEVPILLQVVYTSDHSKSEVYWEVTRLDIPDRLIKEKDLIKELIATAFETYKLMGTPDDNKEKIKAICRFKEGV